MRYLLWLAILLALVPAASQAQVPVLDWDELQTNHMTILYPRGDLAAGQTYAAFVDELYEDITAQLGYQPAPPLVLRVYPTQASYAATNPLAQRSTGFVAHAHTGRREISVALERGPDQTDADVRNVVRHELVHIIAADLAQGQLSTMWHEGIAQYAEVPSEQQTIKVALLRRWLNEDRLYAWSRLETGSTMYDSPEVGYPQSWSMASFLIQRNGMPRFTEFLRACASTASNSAALKQVYGVSAGLLEEEWRVQLSDWLDGGWQRPPPSVGDPFGISGLLAAGRYADAEAAAQTALDANADPLQRDNLARQLALARQGLQTEAALGAARAALIEGDYPRAARFVELARRQSADLSRPDLEPLFADYTRRIDAGNAARADLDAARAELRRLRWTSARDHLDTAALGFSRLDDQTGLAEARSLLATLNQRLRLAGLVLLSLVLLGLAWTIDRRRAARRRQLPLG